MGWWWRRISSGRGARATVSVLVTDATPVNRTTVAVTLVYFVPLTVLPEAAAFVVSPEFTGAVHSLVVTGGLGDYSFEREAGEAALTVDAAGRISLVTPLPAGRLTMAVFAVRDTAATVRFTLSLRVAAKESYGSGRLFFVGGRGGGYFGDVWRSTDGVSWVSLTVSMPSFAGRSGHRVVSHRGSLWLVGGRGRSSEDFYDDVWRSADGVDWSRVSISGAVVLAAGGA